MIDTPVPEGGVIEQADSTTEVFAVASKVDGGEWALLPGIHKTQDEAYESVINSVVNRQAATSWGIVKIVALEGTPLPIDYR